MRGLFLFLTVWSSSASVYAQMGTAADFTEAQSILIENCSFCHGTFAEPPKMKFLSNMAFYFDFSGDGKHQKMPKRMSGVRLTLDEVRVLKEWVALLAPDSLGNPTITVEQADKLIDTP